MQTNLSDIQSIFDTLRTEHAVGYAILVALLYAIAIFIVIFIIRKFLHLFRKRSPNLVDGLIIIMNFSALAFWVAISAPLFNVDQSVLFGGSALGIALVGISASYLGANFMGGLFIIFTRPFGVGDIISYNGTIGLVTEIGLNYTKLVKLNKTEYTVCNSNLVNALIHNSSAFVKQNTSSNEVEIDLTDEDPSKKKGKNGVISLADKAYLKFNPNKLTHSLVDSLNIKKIVRLSYTFDIRQDMPNLDTSITGYETRLKNLCKEFTDTFGFEPEFFFVDNYWRLTTTIVITSISAKTLFDNYSKFLEGILRNAYQIDLGGV